jgi:GTPase SAR1 family protein
MVKLIFDPKRNEPLQPDYSKQIAIAEQGINPFKDTESIQPLNCSSPTEPFKPQSTSDVIGMDGCLFVLKEWYSGSLTDCTKEFLLLVGPTGCGKTTLVELFCKESNIELYYIRWNDSIKTKKDIFKELFCFADFNKSTTFFKSRKETTNKLIVIDEYQNGPNDIVSATDITNLWMLRKKGVANALTPTEVRELNAAFGKTTPLAFPPVVIIAADSKGSKLGDFKKTSQVYYIPEVSGYYIKVWIQSVLKQENIDISDQQLTALIQQCKSDKRQLLETVLFLKNTTNKDNYLHSFKKYYDTHVYDFTDSVLIDSGDPLDLSHTLKVYETDGYIIANLVQENYLDYCSDIHAIANAAESISLGELFFSDTYSSSRQFIPTVHCLNSICIPSYYAKNPYKSIKGPVRTCIFNNRYNILLNNKKLVAKVGISIEDILYIKKFLNHGLVKKRVLTQHEAEYLKNILGTLENEIPRLELIYKHFSLFEIDMDSKSKVKNFTIKFKEKLTNLVG